MSNRTFAIIKPDAVKAGNTGKIYDRILSAGFNILSAKLIKMTIDQAKGFYAVHAERPFYGELTEFMSSGQSMVLALEKENAVLAWRDTIGATNPDEAAEGTIRKDFATSIGENAVHGSDSDENAKIEIGFFFTESELIANH
ncbi:MAG: nucleoside-diphosphate kinase [Candidatus Marinimicrobia bacterium]|jgi:nucleoside-diphosphate kinase|nr:nucleoside-diphosphate kinase [Candidatus Neomarinimicrobiota bacterium]MDP6852920.1 nucleoside-diphosphate kinase [Candidatus Neomarinimicrobiota bacterium]MDP6935967.1 nucleoside-diphosphate kinase [Candidatus Neomarinimicrobiota bacterium]